MNTPIMKLSTAAICLAFATCASAATLMSKDDYKAAKKGISNEVTAAKASCKSLKANAKDICMAEAKGKETIALAQLEESYQPSDKTRYDVLVAHAKAIHAVSKEKCDDLAGNPKDVCVKEAAAVQTRSMADAKTKLKTAQANKTASEKTAKASGDAGKTITEARKDGAAEKRQADYAVAKEKCDALAGQPKEQCVKDAKAAYGQT